MRPQNEQTIDILIGRAFLAAQLLTASAARAESAAMEAIASWDHDEETQETLFLKVVDAAIRNQAEPDETDSCLPRELQAVLKLRTPLRHCFVLRFLAGMSKEVCAGTLRLHPREVDEYTCATLESLTQSRPVSDQSLTDIVGVWSAFGGDGVAVVRFQ